MFFITTKYQKSRSRHHPDGAGRVIFRIARRAGGESDCAVRMISSDIRGDRDSVVGDNRAEIVRRIRMIYCIIEARSSAREPFSVDDVAEEFRMAARGDRRMAGIVERAGSVFPLRADLVSVGNEFKRDFSFVYPEEGPRPDGLLEYVALLSQRAKNDGKSSCARSYGSTRASLSRYLGGPDIAIENVSRPFIIGYSSWLQENGVADSTRFFYLRTLRLVLNRAKEDGYAVTDGDLFAGLGINATAGAGSERFVSLGRDTLRRIAELRIPGRPDTETVRDMFMFGFYCHGMELVDVLNLTESDVQGDMLRYRRRTTGHSRTVALDSGAREIIERYRSPGNAHIFPIKDKYQGRQQYSVSDMVRRHIKCIGNAVGCPGLTFGMNISVWRRLVSEVSVSDMLLSGKM